MPDDRYRRTNRPDASSGAKRNVPSASAPRPAGPDPLVELARLIGQNESLGSSPPRPRATRRRAEPGYAEPPAADRDEPAAYSRGADPDPDYSRSPDQRYDGYTEPSPPGPAASRRSLDDDRGWPGSAPDLDDPHRVEVGWRRPQPKQRRTAPPDDAMAAYRPAARDDRIGFGERNPARAPEPMPSVERAAKRGPASAREDYSRHAPAGEAAFDRGYGQAAEAGRYYDDDGRAIAAEAGRYYDDDGRAIAAEAGLDHAHHDYDGYDDYDAYDAYDYGGHDYETHYRKPRPRLWAAVALLALAVIGTAGAYGYRSMMGGAGGNTDPPVIRADAGPKKIASAAQSASDKQIKERLASRDSGERLVSREEQPKPIQDPNASMSLVPGIGPSAPTPPVVSAPATTTATVSGPPGMQPSPSGSTSTEPKKIKTVTIRPQGDPAGAAPAQAAPAAAPAQAAPAAPPPMPNVRPATPARSAAPSTSEPLSITPRSAPAAPRRRQAALPPPPPRTSARGYFVQLSAQKSRANARSSFRVMQRKYPSVLAGRQLVIRRKDLGRRGIYYGAQVGPFASRRDAVRFCRNLKAAGGNCIIQRN